MAENAIVVEVLGLEDLLQRLGPLTTFATLRPAMDTALKLLQNDLAIYPPQAHRKLGGFKSDKQRRYVMMLVRTGQVPYRRTGTLGRRWATKIESSSTNLVGTVGNNTSYGPYVMDRGQQAWMHQGVWHTAQDVAERNTEAVLGLFAEAVQTALRG